MTERWIDRDDAVEAAQERAEETGQRHYVYYQEPRFTGPAGAGYYVTDTVEPGGRLIWPLDKSSHARRTGYLNGYQYNPRTFEGEIDITDVDEFCGEVVSQIHDHEMQYSPWEFFSSELNDSADPDSAWDAFDNGIRAGARRKWRESQE